jgi:hypothetical protein
MADRQVGLSIKGDFDMMMQMDGGMMDGMMGWMGISGFIWTLVGILVIVLLVILIGKQLKR